MRTTLLLLAFASLPLLGACGGNVATQPTGGAATTTSSSGVGGTTTDATSTTSTGTTSTSTSSSGTGGGAPHGCQSSADCNGKPCVPITPGGYMVCLDPVAEATSCAFPMGQNQCCKTADCPAGGGCYPAGSIQACGGAFPAFNECIADKCTTDADCIKSSSPAICAPAGAFGYPKRECITAYCHTDADCKAKPGGACVPIGGNPCCTLQIPGGLGCAYPGDCAAGAACPNNGLCQLDPSTGTSTCMMFQGCPP